MNHFPAAFLQAFAIIAFLCAVVGGVLAVCWAACEGEDLTYTRQRVDGMGSPLTVAPSIWPQTNPATWQPRHSATPIYDQLAAERLAAELDDDDAVAKWMEGA